MRPVLSIICTLLLCSNSIAAELHIGSPSPDLTAKLLDSNQIFQLSKTKGKVVIVNFWATWCAPCQEEMPALQAYYDKHKAEGLEVLAISMDDARELAAVRRMAQSFTFPIALKSDADVKGLGRIWRMPTTFVIDKEGLLRKNGQEGDAEISTTELDTLVTPLLAK